MGIQEAERRVQQLSALTMAQLSRIRTLEEQGKDLTSAKIIFDSLRVSLFLTIQGWHRARCDIVPSQVRNDASRASLAWESKPNLVVIPNKAHQSYVARRIGPEPSMKLAHDLLELAEAFDAKETKQTNEQLSTLSATEYHDGQKNNTSTAGFVFRPLTEGEKSEFVNSLNGEGKQILAQLAGETKRSEEFAA